MNRREAINDLLNKYHAENKFNGSVIVAEGEGIILKGGYGYANMEWKIPNESDTRHRLGSITKQFTAMMILQLIEENKLSTNSYISDYLPYYREDFGRKITIHHLLSHTSGIPNYTDFPGFMDKSIYRYYQPDDFIKAYCSHDLEFEPGTKMVYSNSGYYILGSIIEKITDKSYEQALHDKILNPLNMRNTGYDKHATILEKRASGYNINENGIENATYIDTSVAYASGAMYSTVEDMYLWDQALYTSKLVSNNYIKCLSSPNLKNYSYGWFTKRISISNIKDFLEGPFEYDAEKISSDNNVVIMEHEGGIPGFHTIIVRVLDYNQLVVLLNNTGGTCLNEIASKIITVLNEK